MLSFDSISLEGFKAFRAPQKFVFPTKPGLYLVTGENKVSPRLGPNGVGKSTLPDAICWCLYGHTVRGLKAGEVVTRGQKHAKVSLDAQVGDTRLTISRSQSPNGLTLNGRVVDQEAVTKALRVNADGFLASVIRPQFGDGFLSLKPAEKLTLFSQIMELDFWLEKSGLAHELVAEFETEIQLNEWRRTSLDTQIKTALEDVEALKLKEERFEAEREQRVAHQKANLSRQKQLAGEITNKLLSRHSALDKLSIAFKKYDKKLDGTADKLEGINKQIAKLDAELHMLTSLKKKAANDLRLLPGVGAVCPHCRQTVSGGHLKAEAKRLSADIRETEIRMTEISQMLDGITKDKKAIFKDISNTKYDRCEVEEQRNTLADEIATLREQGKASEQIIADARSVLEQLTTDINPYADIIRQKAAVLKAFNASKAEASGKIKQLNEELAAVKPWTTGFKKLRLFVVEQTLKQLEIEINNNLASLGMPDWAITLDVERENKSGGLTKGFVVYVHAPDYDKPVRFESWSGGETQRLCLAGDMGLSNLIMERAGLANDIEFYDEPSARLSAEGLNDLAETLAERAEATNKRIFLIDHHIIDFGRFAGILRIIKDSDGSRFSDST